MKWINRSLIHSPIYYGLCLTEKDFHKELRRLKVPRSHWPVFITDGKTATAHFLSSKEIETCCIVCIKKTRKNIIETASLLCHEAVHIWQVIKEEMGEDKPSEEFEAYSIQMITQNLLHAYLKGK